MYVVRIQMWRAVWFTLVIRSNGRLLIKHSATLCLSPLAFRNHKLGTDHQHPEADIRNRVYLITKNYSNTLETLECCRESQCSPKNQVGTVGQCWLSILVSFGRGNLTALHHSEVPLQQQFKHLMGRHHLPFL
jgi:hypothetical protein